MNKPYDVAIIGSGFSGSILARILAGQGQRVALLDAAQHPRFAIGESSTPIADLLLRRLGERYGLSDLQQLSTYGSWQQSLPELACGMKRGFSYFDHRNWNPESFVGERSLLVAASATDIRSDTHWFRSDVDAFLFDKAIGTGVDARQGFVVESLQLSTGTPALIRSSQGEPISAHFVVDASGAAAVSARSLGVSPWTARLLTRTCAAFAHFRHVESFTSPFNSAHHDDRASNPFDSDAAAQHHLIDHGWAWMLRMNNGITSVGISAPLVADGQSAGQSGDQTLSSAKATLLNRFPNHPLLAEIMSASQIVTPEHGAITIQRLQRFYDPVVANHCLLTPTTSATIDPLHSTGIAHALAGVERIAKILSGPIDPAAIAEYRSNTIAEITHLDRLVAMAYASMHSFKRFTASCMVYFAAAIECEERLGRGELVGALWQADDDAFCDAVVHCEMILRSNAPDDQVWSAIRERLSPWNRVGLMNNPQNRYAYTATK